MKLSLIILILFSTPIFCHGGLEDLKDVIKDPIISRRCKSLLKSRSEKLRIQQKLHAMLLRNQRLQDQVKINERTAKQKLKLNKTQISNNLRLTAIRIESMEENIVRKGCPGITL